jgi:hypothetical protein
MTGDLSLEERDIQELECLINELPVLEALKELDNITITYPDKSFNILKDHAETLLGYSTKYLSDFNLYNEIISR